MQVVWALCILPLLLFFTPLSLRASAEEDFIDRLQNALNRTDSSLLNGLVDGDVFPNLENSYISFLADFPNAKWTVQPSGVLKDGRQLVEISVTGTRNYMDQEFILEAKQRIALRSRNDTIISHQIISEQSLLRSANTPLSITIQIPNSVLTGSRYDIDVLFDEPLGDAMVAGGLIDLTPKEIIERLSPLMQLQPMYGGGLFKSVLAPFKPGFQQWAALLVHPDGLVSLTKRVLVVDSKQELIP